MQSYIKINKALLPLAFIYGTIVEIRNWLYDVGIKKSHTCDKPVIGIGNLTVGGTGKTPHVEYLIRLLKDTRRVAVLSRGYRRSTHGFLLATDETTSRQIGDEPWQMHNKFPEIQVAVDKDRCHGVGKLNDAEVVILDDSYQHRRIKPGLNILLIDSNRMVNEDKMLPAGRLREHIINRNRADIIIATKCPTDMKPIDFRVMKNTIGAFPYQKLFFTTLEYGKLYGCFNGREMTIEDLSDKHVLLLSGIAVPQQMRDTLSPYCKEITEMTFADHHRFSKSEIKAIDEHWKAMAKQSLIITTEKDEARLKGLKLTDDIKENLFVLPIAVRFLENEDEFNKMITDYVTKNS